MRPLFVEELAVHPDLQGCGLGSFMLEQVEQLGQVAGLHSHRLGGRGEQPRSVAVLSKAPTSKSLTPPCFSRRKFRLLRASARSHPEARAPRRARAARSRLRPAAQAAKVGARPASQCSGWRCAKITSMRRPSMSTTSKSPAGPHEVIAQLGSSCSCARTKAARVV